MTSTHTFEWETCNEPGEFFIEEHKEEYKFVAECTRLVRRCCDEHKKISLHTDHNLSLEIRVNVGGEHPSQTATLVPLLWYTKEAVIGLALSDRMDINASRG